jgi:NAD(P)H dehydrogenase (quinone)
VDEASHERLVLRYTPQEQTMILVTGATGHLGKIVINNLLKHVPPDKVAALVRAQGQDKAADLRAQGVTIRLGDYDDVPALDSAMRGIQRILLISGTDEENRIRQHGHVIDAAKRAGVELIGYTSRALKDPAKSENNLMEGHFRTEDLIRESGIAYAIFRNALYMDTLPLFLRGDKVFETGIHLPAGYGRVSYALRTELGEAMARVMREGTKESRTYLLSAHEAWSFDDVAAALSELSGQRVPYVPIDRATFEERMRKVGLPEMMIQRVYGFYCDIRDGQLDEVSPELETLLGRKPASLKDGLSTLFSAPTR